MSQIAVIDMMDICMIRMTHFQIDRSNNTNIVLNDLLISNDMDGNKSPHCIVFKSWEK